MTDPRTEMHGVKGTFAEGIFFTEDDIPTAERRGSVSALRQRQNVNLGHVKKALAVQAKTKQANAVVNFRYGQKRAWLAWDNGLWYGDGEAVFIPDAGSSGPGVEPVDGAGA